VKIKTTIPYALSIGEMEKIPETVANLSCKKGKAGISVVKDYREK